MEVRLSTVVLQSYVNHFIYLKNESLFNTIPSTRANKMSKAACLFPKSSQNSGGTQTNKCVPLGLFGLQVLENPFQNGFKQKGGIYCLT